MQTYILKRLLRTTVLLRTPITQMIYFDQGIHYEKNISLGNIPNHNSNGIILINQRTVYKVTVNSNL